MTKENGKDQMIQALLEKIISHAAENKVNANNGTAKCVDGRYQGGEAEGAIALPGGHLGLSMALLSLGRTPQEAFSQVYNFVIDNGGRYGFHSDDHGGCGCGHCKAAMENGGKYGVDGNKVTELWEIVNAKLQESPNTMTFVELSGGHAEEAILVVKGSSHTVKPLNSRTGEQVFVYDADRVDQLASELVKFINKNGREKISAGKLKKILGDQLNATLALLDSSNGKPMFEVNFGRDGKLSVNHIGFAPTS